VVHLKKNIGAYFIMFDLYFQKSFLVTLKEITLSWTITSMLRAILSISLALQYSFTGLHCKRKRMKLQFKSTEAFKIVGDFYIIFIS